MDNETRQILSDAEEIRGMLATRGWSLVKAKLDQRILDLQNINNLDATSPENMVADLRARKMAVELLWTWLKTEVYGAIETPDMAPKEESDGFIERLK